MKGSNEAFFSPFHLSDFHFGESFNAVHAHAFPGTETHSIEAAGKLAELVAKETKGHASRIVVTGDLTTWGTLDSFSTADTYLRQAHQTRKHRIGLQSEDAIVVPGNHDLWQGMLLGGQLTFSSLQPHEFPWLMNVFAPARFKATPIGSNQCPYPFQVCLYENEKIRLQLYGLDSNQVDQTPITRINRAGAGGFISSQQLDDLSDYVQNRESKNCPTVVRIASLHHPLVYVDAPPYIGARPLLNQTSVVHRLKELNFSLGLSGHQHRGFLYPLGLNSQDRHFYALSAGAATQRTPLLSVEEEAWLSTPGDKLYRAHDKRAWSNAVHKANSCSIYDFLTDDTQTRVDLFVRMFSNKVRGNPEFVRISECRITLV